MENMNGKNWMKLRFHPDNIVFNNMDHFSQINRDSVFIENFPQEGVIACHP